MGPEYGTGVISRLAGERLPPAPGFLGSEDRRAALSRGSRQAGSWQFMTALLKRVVLRARVVGEGASQRLVLNRQKYF